MELRLQAILLLTISVAGCVASPDEVRLLTLMRDLDSIHVMTTTPISRSGEVVHVDVKMYLFKIIDLDERNEVLNLQFIMIYTWIDARVSWNASDFGGLNFSYVSLSYFWHPQVLIYNQAKDEIGDEISAESNFIRLFHNGLSVWSPRYDRSSSQCDLDLVWFPFDIQRCDVIFDEWKYSTAGVLMTASDGPGAFNTSFLVEDDVWDVIGTSVKSERAAVFSRVVFQLVLRRKPQFYVITLIVPYCLLSSIAVFSLIMQASSCSDRVNIGVTIVLSLSVYQIIVTDKLPPSSDNTPVIVMYFMFAMIVCVACVFCSTLILFRYQHAEAVPFVEMLSLERRVICRYLATCVGMKPKPSSPPPLHMKQPPVSVSSIALNNRHRTSSDGTQRSSNREVLMDIRSLLESREQREMDREAESTMEEEKRNEWRLAAAVVDRIFSTLIGLCYFIGTVIFFVLFSHHP